MHTICLKKCAMRLQKTHKSITLASLSNKDKNSIRNQNRQTARTQTELGSLPANTEAQHPVQAIRRNIEPLKIPDIKQKLACPTMA